MPAASDLLSYGTFFLVFASIFAVGFSPLWILAAASDVMGGSKAYLRTLVTEHESIGPEECE